MSAVPHLWAGGMASSLLTYEELAGCVGPKMQAGRQSKKGKEVFHLLVVMA